jgi:putative NIF3 family GTP cyclohydrolase 1 type 2
LAPVTPLSTILDHLDSVLDPAAYDDYGPNGLQVPGRDEIETIVTGVSANAELFEGARDAGADLILVHHGLFWSGPPRPLDRAAKRRLQLLFDADMGLAAYHLPLDAHLEHGNNALLAFTDGPDRVRTVAIASGAGADHLEEAIAAGLDAFITGEPAERVMSRAREAGVHFLAAGHYATETFGVRRLGDLLAERFGIRHVFVDVPNPI